MNKIEYMVVSGRWTGFSLSGAAIAKVILLLLCKRSIHHIIHKVNELSSAKGSSFSNRKRASLFIYLFNKLCFLEYII